MAKKGAGRRSNAELDKLLPAFIKAHAAGLSMTAAREAVGVPHIQAQKWWAELEAGESPSPASSQYRGNHITQERAAKANGHVETQQVKPRNAPNGASLFSAVTQVMAVLEPLAHGDRAKVLASIQHIVGGNH